MADSVIEKIKVDSKKIIETLDNVDFSNINSKELAEISEVLKNMYLIAERDIVNGFVSSEMMSFDPFNCESSSTHY